MVSVVFSTCLRLMGRQGLNQFGAGSSTIGEADGHFSREPQAVALVSVTSLCRRPILLASLELRYAALLAETREAEARRVDPLIRG
jgi:hypothetical protein